LLRDRGEAWHGIWASALMLAIAYGANIGGFFTLIGTAPNALLAGYLQTEFGYEIGFARWMLFAVPIGLILLPLVWAWLCFGSFRLPSRKVREIAQIVQRERAALGTWSHAEQRVLVVFVLTATLWITRPLWPIPGLSDPVIAMLGGLSLFLLPAGGGRNAPILVWEDAKKIPWEVLLLLGGGFSLAETVQSSGLAEYLGTQLKVWGISGGLLLVAAVALLILVLTEITSNSATTAAFLPILGALAVGLGENPVLLCAVATVAASGAFMLPVATPPNAIVFAGGLVTVRQMMRAGIVVNLLFLLLLMVAAHWWGRWIFAR
jgi:sodium-dependent dicarboxylate transporter 2/3/5